MCSTLFARFFGRHFLFYNYLLFCHTQWITSRIKPIIDRLINIKFKICTLLTLLITLQDLCRQTWLKWQCDHRLINDDCRNFDFVGNTYKEAHLSCKLEYQLPNLCPPPPFTWLYNVHSSVVNSTPYLIKKSHALYVGLAPTQATQGEPTFHGFP